MRSFFYCVLPRSALLGVLLLFNVSASPQQQALPDLTIDSALLASSWRVTTGVFKSTSCDVLEGCVGGAGKRTLLRFAVATPNVGAADLYLGNPVGNPLFVYSSCHKHYHFSGYAEYNLHDPGTDALVLPGRKQAFCLLDSSQYLPGNYPSHGYKCTNQGISVGWQDVYSTHTTCQWLDVTGVPPGTYVLEVIVNPNGVAGGLVTGLAESDYSNNSARTTITIN